MLADGDRIRIPKTSEVVAETIRRRIVLGELKENESLPSEAELMSRFNVSRPILREAMRILESESLITLPRGTRTGATVHRPSREVAARHIGILLQVEGVTLVEVWDVTTSLLAAAAGALARNRTSEDLRRLTAVVAELRAVEKDAATFIERAAEFNTALLRLARNRASLMMVGVLHDILHLHIELAARDWRQHPAHAPDASSALAGMEQLVELIGAKRADDAEAFWRRQMEDGAHYFLEHYEPKSVVEILS
jgi:GntR family transcriptional repressor for pyruvate dehydrogenase complex